MLKHAPRNVAFWIVCGFVSVGLVASSFAGKKVDPPKGKVVIKDCASKKPTVEFDHAAHVKAVEAAKQDCTACHHLVDKKEPEKHLCGDCHKEAKGKLGTCQEMSTTKNPFHVACIGCHKKVKDTSPKAPTSCNDCHKK